MAAGIATRKEDPRKQMENYQPVPLAREMMEHVDAGGETPFLIKRSVDSLSGIVCLESPGHLRRGYDRILDKRKEVVVCSLDFIMVFDSLNHRLPT